MNPIAPAALPDPAAILAISSILLIPLALAGISLINTGLGRSRNAAHAMLSSFAVLGVAAGAYFLCGFAWESYIGGPAHTISLGAKDWNVIGAQSFFFTGLPLNGAGPSLAAWMQLLAVGLAALIPIGAGTDR